MSYNKEEKLFEAITDVKDEFVEETHKKLESFEQQLSKTNQTNYADQRFNNVKEKNVDTNSLYGDNSRKKSFLRGLFGKRYFKFATVCCALILVSSFLLSRLDFRMGGGSSSGAGSDGASSEGTGNVASTFMSYAGPVFPLTSTQENYDADHISVDRSINYDFSYEDENDVGVRGSTVTDSYILTNNSTESQDMTLYYPFVSDLLDLDKLAPKLSVDGNEITDYSTYFGNYSGSFMGVGGDREEGSYNLRYISSFEEYKELLNDGTYFENALILEEIPELPVTVYAFSDFESPQEEEYPAAHFEISFDIDHSKTDVLTFGFDGGSYSEDHMGVSFSVPDKDHRDYYEHNFVIVIGEDIEEYSLQGYKNGATDKGNELDDVSATVKRYETTLDNVLSVVTEYSFNSFDNFSDDFPDSYIDLEERFSLNAADTGNKDKEIFQNVTQEMFDEALYEMFYSYGLFSEKQAERYDANMLEDYISEARTMDRVVYLEFEVTIPANSSVEINADMQKAPSYNFYGSGSDDQDLQGYDLATKLGSNLNFETITAEISGDASIEIVNQNFGFDLQNGVTEVVLDVNTEHYFMEITQSENN